MADPLHNKAVPGCVDDAIAALYVREINCGCETFWDGGIKVWIGDAVNGQAPKL